MSQTAGTEAVLRAIVLHISRIPFLSDKAIGNALYGLQNMSQTDGTEAVLQAMERYILQAPALGAQNIGNALSGLQNMQPTAGTQAVLDALVERAEDISVDGLGDIPPKTYLTECIFSVRNHLANPSAQSLIIQISNSLNLPLREQDLTPETYPTTLWRLQSPQVRQRYGDQAQLIDGGRRRR
ncbi:hypothetical protein [Dyella sp. M7H15-1]|uniref:hypothetical protein n=1 Tax=Dyella sp. M7H15-1 TaxID=2501295 RepID=UPI0013E8BC69|nr:hypothetical protein [Dyella sp. M7H15-1]